MNQFRPKHIRFYVTMQKNKIGDFLVMNQITGQEQGIVHQPCRFVFLIR
uniref:Uncharacterized protein n=1 Tax=Arundo donax TaxID=35708 RepID=A0A0A8ZHU8_ARUDO